MIDLKIRLGDTVVANPVRTWPDGKPHGRWNVWAKAPTPGRYWLTPIDGPACLWADKHFGDKPKFLELHISRLIPARERPDA